MRILVVEDEKILANSIKSGLVDEHFAVDVCYDGVEGHGMAVSEEYDVVVLDVMLPGMDGFTICRELRKHQNTTPVLMLTARDTVEDRVSGLNIGADDYLVKPFSFNELVARIRSLIRRASNNTVVLTVGNLILDPSSHIVTRNGEEINLTGKEYALLEYFMRHPHQVLTRDQIISHVWDYSYDSLSNTVEVIIKRLREKIDKAFPQDEQLLNTIRGLGYRLG